MLTKRIFWLVGLALAPALAIQGYNEIALRAAREESVRTDTLRAAQAAAADLAVVADSLREGLDFIAQEKTVLDKDAAACSAYLAASRAHLPGVVMLALTDRDGHTVCNSIGSSPGSFSVADRAYHQRALATNGFVVGDYVEGLASGQRTIHFAQPLRARDGTVTGVVAAALNLNWLAQRLARSGLPSGTALSVLDATGRVLVRAPDQDLWAGRRIDGERLREVQANVGQARDTMSLDGRRSIAAVVRPEGATSGLTVSVGRERSAAFADIDVATRRGLILIALGAALAFAATLLASRLLIRRPVRRLLAAARAWRQGDLSARTGIAGVSEFGQLGEAFDAMAVSLERHEGDLKAEIVRSHALQGQQTTMLHELNHRVKNTLATVQSLARQARGGGNGAENLERRILALSKTHDLLTRDEWTGAGLREILENELGPYRNSVDHFTLDGPEVELLPRYVLALGMTVHELTTNAAKYGALSIAEGRVHVTWQVARGEAGGQRLVLSWQEEGGPVVAAPTRRGFGTRLIAGGIQRELDGEVSLSFEPTGLRCLIDVPLAEGRPGMLAPNMLQAH